MLMFTLLYLHADEIDSSKLGGHNIIKATDLGFLSSGQVQSATSVADLEATVNATVCHADVEQEKKVVNDGLDLASNLGDITSALVQSATSVQDLVSDTQAGLDGRRGPTVKD